MWSQNSWGSLMTIQMTAAAPKMARGRSRAGSRQMANVSYQMKKYSKVLGKRNSRARRPVSSNRATPTSRQ